MDTNLVNLIRENALSFGRRTAVRFEKSKVSYRKLDELSDKLSTGLKTRLGISKGDHVCIMMGNCLNFVISYFGILKAGAWVIPVNTFLVAEEVRFILEDSKAKVVFVDDKLLRVVEEAVKGMSNPPDIILTGDKESKDFVSLDALFVDGAHTVAEIHPDDIAVLIYTSGTTGIPKGAMLTHRNLVSNVKDCIKALRIKKRDRVIVFLPMFHSFTLTVCMLTPLIGGASFIILRSVRPFDKVLKTVILRRITAFVGIPQIFHLLSEKKVPWLVKKLLSIRFCISGSAPLSEEVLKNFENNTGLPLMEGYGLSEASPVVSVNPLYGTRKVGSVGIPLSSVDVKIVNDEEKELSCGEKGEIIVKGPNVMKGYFNKPEETSKAIKGDWLFTGDIGKIDSDRYLYILDRKKDMILSHGLNVYPREIEQVLYQHPSIRDAAVIGVKDVRRGEKAVAYVTLKEGFSAQPGELIKFCKGKLAPYKIPHTVKIVTELPRTPTGKILKKDIKKMVEARA
ncbi:MAG: long-chain fatty acid--CoA ligase [Candidatus Aureabacteria bacterium]|nr:long-chain fatty acid--CoA ligase [Candidatus Auribacterota bacterium]